MVWALCWALCRQEAVKSCCSLGLGLRLDSQREIRTDQKEGTRGHTGRAVERDQKQEGAAGQTLACGTKNYLFLLSWELRASDAWWWTP